VPVHAVEPGRDPAATRFYRQQDEAAAQRSKRQPAQTVPQPGSVEWFKAQQNEG
jgi:hypothetical protein